MTTSAFNATVVYIQDSQIPVRLALNLMMNMLSQNTDKSGKTLLDQNVHRIAEVLVITQTNRLPSREQLLQLVECYENEIMTNIMRKDMMQKLSEGIFQESPIKKDKSTSKPTPRSRSAVQMKGSDSDSDLDQNEQEVQTRSMSDDDFKARMNYHLSVPIKSSVQDKVREEELLEKYMQNLGKFEVAHIVAMVLHVVIPKEAIEEQGRGMSSIFKALDSKTQILIEVPISSGNAGQSQVQSLQASTALVCLIMQIQGQDHS